MCACELFEGIGFMSAGLKIIVGALMEAVRRLRDVIILARVTSS